MIVVYAQATDRQGVDAAIDAELVDSEDIRFLAVRQKSKTLNLMPPSARAGELVVHVGQGVVRVQLQTVETQGSSRVVIVLSSRSFRGDSEHLLSGVLRSAAAIDRTLDPTQLASALALASEVVEATERRKLVALGLASSLLGVGVAALALAMSRRRHEAVFRPRRSSRRNL